MRWRTAEGLERFSRVVARLGREDHQRSRERFLNDGIAQTAVDDHC